MTLVYCAVVVAVLAVGAVATGLVHVPGFDSGTGTPATSITQQADVQAIDEGDHTVGGRIATITPDLAKAHQLNRTNGVLIVEAFKNSPLEQAGVRTNDVVLAIDGVPVNDVVSFATKVRLTPIGQQLALTLDRGSATENHSVTVSRCMVREGGPGALRPCQAWTH
jgi:S1-C subfamily serine protease